MEMRRIQSDRIMCISIDMEKTGKNIRKHMLQKGYSVKAIMEITGVTTEQAVYKWLGGRSLPSLESLIVLSIIFETDISDLLVEYKPIAVSVGSAGYATFSSEQIESIRSLIVSLSSLSRSRSRSIR